MAGYPRAARPQQNSQPRPNGATASAVSPQRALIDRYCVTCHNERAKTGGLMLDKMDMDHPGAGADVWEKAIRKLAIHPGWIPRPKCF